MKNRGALWRKMNTQLVTIVQYSEINVATSQIYQRKLIPGWKQGLCMEIVGKLRVEQAFDLILGVLTRAQNLAESLTSLNY